MPPPHWPQHGVPPGWPGQPPAASLPPDAPRRDGWGVFWLVVLILDLVAIGLNMLLGIILGAAQIFAPGSPLDEFARENLAESSAASIWLSTALSLAMFGVLPFAWAWGSRAGGLRGALLYLRMKAPGRSMLRGALWAVPLVLFFVAVQAGYVCAKDGCGALLEEAAGEENPVVEGIVANLTWPLVVFIALSAGVGEEILFRGVLQRWIGWVGQGVLFGVAHATGGSWLQIAATLAIGLVFGYLVAKRNVSLWAVIACHVMYDFILLALALSYRDEAQAASILAAWP